MNKSTIISVIAIGLVFLYWYNKRSSRQAVRCADIWDNLENKDARNLYFNALGLTENDADIKANLTQQAQQNSISIDYLKCKWAVKYLATTPNGIINDTPIINGAEETRIFNCMCSKFNS
jgi:hypothetical protein